jgi:hypothetical protein
MGGEGGNFTGARRLHITQDNHRRPKLDRFR